MGGGPCGWRPAWLVWAGPLERTGAPLSSAGPNLKEWLREQFCDHPLERCEDTRLHDAAYVGDLQTLRSLLQEEGYRRWAWPPGGRPGLRPLPPLGGGCPACLRGRLLRLRGQAAKEPRERGQTSSTRPGGVGRTEFKSTAVI